ncbi:MAG: sigma-70 family RNA polymerase sigma factor [Oscillospiraceae bacterium]|nr:sigma-70 family RNA polymerase sigma factor [Oscillospiraceae bacterium]
MEDKQIVTMLFARAEGAIEALAERFGRPLLRIAKNILENFQDAEECVSDTYLALWNAIPPAKPDPLAPYVYRTGRNIALNRLSRDLAAKRNSRYDLSLDELNGYLPDENLEHTLDARAVGRAIDRFLAGQTQENRYIFLRRYWYGDSVAEIANALQRKENAVSVRLNRLRSSLKGYPCKEGFFYEP